MKSAADRELAGFAARGDEGVDARVNERGRGRARRRPRPSEGTLRMGRREVAEQHAHAHAAPGGAQQGVLKLQDEWKALSLIHI